MRIITGAARGTLLEAPEGMDTRPTSERAKQGVFNILQFEIAHRRVLDLFAGSGQMALEALSRGAGFAVMADASENVTSLLRRNAEKTHFTNRCSVQCGDFRRILKSLEGKDAFDLVFLDPPYALGLLPETLSLLNKYHLLLPGAILVCEDEKPEPVEADGLQITKFVKYGRLHMTILKKEESV